MDRRKERSETTPDDMPNAARIYDYLLGGYHNFEADRGAAQRIVEFLPDMPLFMRTNRAFLRRVVRFLVDQGIDQFLDLGSGIPTVGNVHEVAQGVDPSARIVYVDNEPIAVRHSEEILRNNPNATVIQADIRQPEVILNHPEVRQALDLSKPSAVLLLSVLLFVPDSEEVHRIVRVLRDALAPDSYIAISHPTADDLPREQEEQSLPLYDLYESMGTPVAIRPYTEVERLFDGLKLVEPGVVRIPLWRPEGPEDLLLDQPERSGYYVGVGRKP